LKLFLKDKKPSDNKKNKAPNPWFNYQKYYAVEITGNEQPLNVAMKYENLKKPNSDT